MSDNTRPQKAAGEILPDPEELDPRLQAQWTVFGFAMLATAVFTYALDVLRVPLNAEYRLPQFFIPSQAAVMVAVLLVVLGARAGSDLDLFDSTAAERGGKENFMVSWLRERHFLNGTIKATFVLFVVAEFTIYCAVAQSTGGIQSSANSALVLTFILLGPTIMLGKTSVLVLAVPSSAIVSALYIFPDFLKFGSVMLESYGVEDPGYQHMAVSVMSIVVSLLAAWRFKKKEDEVSGEEGQNVVRRAPASRPPSDLSEATRFDGSPNSEDASP